MHEAIAAAVCADAYTDALTLGPFPGVFTGADVTVQGAAVYAQLYRNADTGIQTLDDREYLFLPGSRHVDNIAGIRFRNQIAGIPAIVTASLSGPDSPQVGPIFGDIPLVGAPLLVPQPVQCDATGQVTPFNGIPPSGYGALLIYAANANGGPPLFLQLTSLLPGGLTGNQFVQQTQQVYLPQAPGTGRPIFWVVAVPATAVTVAFVHGAANQGNLTLGVWPTNLAPGTYLPSGSAAAPNPVLYEADNLAVANGVTSLDLPTPFVGPVSIIVGGTAVANLLFSINLLDSTGTRIGLEVQQAMSGPAIISGGFLVPGRHQVQWVNGTGVAQNVFLSVIGQYGGLS